MTPHFIQRSLTRLIRIIQTKIILEGEIWLEAVGPEKGTAEIIKAKAGDVLRIKKGTVVSFTSPSSGKAFYVGQRGHHEW